MDLVNVSDVSPALFVTGAVLILAMGIFLSLGVLRLFEGKRRQGLALMGASAVSLVVLILVSVFQFG